MSIDIARIKAQIEAKRTHLREILLPTATTVEQQEEANRDPVDPPEAAIDVNEAQDEWFIRQNQEKLLAEVEEALHRIEQGEYGLCVQCHQPIPEKRLLIIPWATRDIVCQQQQDAREQFVASVEENYSW